MILVSSILSDVYLHSPCFNNDYVSEISKDSDFLIVGDKVTFTCKCTKGETECNDAIFFGQTKDSGAAEFTFVPWDGSSTKFINEQDITSNYDISTKKCTLSGDEKLYPAQEVLGKSNNLLNSSPWTKYLN